MLPRTLPFAAALLAAVPVAPAAAQGRVLRHETVVDAPPADVWRAFVEPERMVQWMGVRRADVDLRVGGAMRTTYADEELGGPATIVNRILSYEPARMLSLQNEKAPTGSGLEAFAETWSVFHFEPVGTGRTRVVSVGLGYGEGPEWDRIYEHFERGNAWTFEQLRRHLAGDVAGETEDAESAALSAVPDTPEHRSYRAHVAAAAAALEGSDAAAARGWLDGAPPSLRGWEWRHLDAATDSSTAVFRLDAGELHVLAWAPDGGLLAVGTGDGRILFVDPGTGEAVRELEAHGREVVGLDFSPDGAVLASSGGDARARLWSVATGEELLSFEAHTYPVSSVRFSPDGALLASTSYERPTGGEVRVWSASDGAERHRFQAGYAPMTCADWSPDGRRVHAGSWVGLFATWELGGDAEGRVIEVGSQDDYRAVNALAVSPDGSLVVLGGKDDQLHLFDAATGEKRLQIDAHERAVWGVALAPDGELLASASQDGSIGVWDPESGRALARLLGHGSTVRGLAFAPDGGALASASADGTVRLWDAGALRAPLEGRAFGEAGETYVYHAAESPDGRYLAVAFHDGRTVLSSRADGAELRVLEHEDWVNWIDFTADGGRLLTAGQNGLAVWDPATGERLFAVSATRGVECAVFSPDGRRIASGARDDTARIFDGTTGEELLNLPHPGVVREVCFSPDGSRLVTSTYRDPTARVFDVASGELVLELDGHPEGVDAAAFGPGGEWIATTSEDGALRLWRASDGALLEAVPGHQGRIQSLAIHPDGSRIATGGADYRILLWDVATRRPVLSVEDEDGIYALRFSADGERLLAVPLENRYRVLHTRPLRERVAGRGGEAPSGR